MIRFGTAGWSYDDWQGVVYPRSRPRGFDPLAYLARYFNTVEVNSTFYRPPRPEVPARWVKRVADNDDFKFTAKLWQRFTHQRDEAWTRDEAEAVRAGLDPLAERDRLGAVLVQFPWSFKARDDSFEWLDDVTSEFSGYPLVVEVRHSSWNTPEFHRWLNERGIGFVNIDQPQFNRSIGPTAETSGRVGYVRLHGRNYEDWFREDAGREARYDYLYSSDELELWVERIKELGKDGSVEDVYVVTNNHYRGQAAANAIMLSAMLRGGAQPAPAPLVEAYSEALRPFVVPEEGPQRRLL
ncbi:MAG: DUF72 domain-containing protein [Gemmatimonadetes bacterium]|uniref:DUF72 domain-containing protein n=1 Tax=Candidatus Kutchimonas denitrificans TaxID=3056748 RepID=A0AAE5CDD6_9BACT|nr:DUF72 domain-containing protein [Gemmatimonadota bacterium]NIR75569.1 DUF72 domain-containing protein [Candidatus Kutchimonas denitrificans]NIS01883.1 DUF72 domain-containing protein [Gemmatimonadota bacterium]NIT67664.1 DUF72 domain-containing protein [Gemmatimonadota bacterium]NIU53538.1 DUF72 domain-containing protein [Gemmatimonadota bacterium]